MNKGDSLLIEKVANGFVVRPYASDNRAGVTAAGEVFVFQRLGSPLHEGDSDKSVMDFLAAHFG